MEIFESGEPASMGMAAIAFGLAAWAFMLRGLRWLSTAPHGVIAAGSTLATAAIITGAILLVAG